jgi:hypothetical protein
MAKDTVAPTPRTAQEIASAAFFEEAFGDSVGDATEILNGLQHLILAMGARVEGHDETPAYMICLWRDHLEVLRARVRVLSLGCAPTPWAEPAPAEVA